MKYLVGDMVNGTLKTFSTLAEAEECYADYVEEGNQINAENVKHCLGEDNEGNDIYPELEDASKFYYIQDENDEMLKGGDDFNQ